MFLKIGALKIFARFTVKHLCWSLFLNKVQALDFKTGVFLRILQNFKQQHLYGTPPVAASKGRQFRTLYLCYVLFSRRFKVFFPSAKI